MDDLPTTLEDTTICLSARVKHLLQRQESCPRQRLLIALAGVPGSGKSTVSAALVRTLLQEGIDSVVVVPMDGFHYSKAVLSSFPDPQLAFRKRGAPFTFDVFGLLKLIRTLKTTRVARDNEPITIIEAPSFDHAAQDPKARGIKVSSKTKIVIIEGNYTLLDEPPWNKISAMVDERWFIDVRPEVAKERLIERHLAAGIEPCREAAARRALDNDIPNGDLIRSKLVTPDLRILN